LPEKPGFIQVNYLAAATLAGCGTIEIELAGARMRISGAVDSATLTAVLAALAGGRRR